MGDMNLDFLQWQNPPSGQKDLTDMMKSFMADTSMEQVVTKPTRVARLGDVMVRTLVDH